MVTMLVPSEAATGGGTQSSRPRQGFALPAELEASEPPEARGLARDGVRLMVTSRSSERIVHAPFSELGEFLRPGDVLVINTSGTLAAALPAVRSDGTRLMLHVSTQLPAGLWSVELRTPVAHKTVPFGDGRAGETLALPDGGRVTLLAPHNSTQRERGDAGRVRLWIAALELPLPLHEYLTRHGSPIRYAYVPERWPIDAYQTVYATEPGSAEMPSAGRAFTPELITRLVARGVRVAPLLLHTGVSSLEAHEAPYEEWYRVPATTARLVNETRAAGGQVIAVGTTAVRALETVTDERGVTHPGEGWTSLVITPEHEVRGVHGLLTGLHEPAASHLDMLVAIGGRRQVERAYGAALRERYLWHEFGDLHLLLP